VRKCCCSTCFSKNFKRRKKKPNPVCCIIVQQSSCPTQNWCWMLAMLSTNDKWYKQFSKQNIIQNNILSETVKETLARSHESSLYVIADNKWLTKCNLSLTELSCSSLSASASSSSSRRVSARPATASLASSASVSAAQHCHNSILTHGCCTILWYFIEHAQGTRGNHHEQLKRIKRAKVVTSLATCSTSEWNQTCFWGRHLSTVPEYHSVCLNLYPKNNELTQWNVIMQCFKCTIIKYRILWLLLIRFRHLIEEISEHHQLDRKAKSQMSRSQCLITCCNVWRDFLNLDRNYEKCVTENDKSLQQVLYIFCLLNRAMQLPLSLVREVWTVRDNVKTVLSYKGQAPTKSYKEL